ncbi:hypothetical protein [Manganibacter manganicus]|uniref:Uncharacterized protein n=1 Tax=Manganibacter manganicus TaxID=1873176 RepID=A0A1V8RKN4_9HYPH|nr:hypothetical protein [Pseudaminobacter manganicus]OQM73771.1 hypothetical protein BFN67_07630 [Pseudaminobacter manganicus]
MRKTLILAAAATMTMMTAAANAQQQPAAPTSPTPATPAPATPGAPTIRAVNIVDIEKLPKETQNQVNDAVAQRGEAGMKELRGSIDATPELASALKEKGLTSQDVIVASLDERGVLTLVTRKKAG